MTPVNRLSEELAERIQKASFTLRMILNRVGALRRQGADRTQGSIRGLPYGLGPRGALLRRDHRMTNPGVVVTELLASAERDVRIVAPFIRSAALERLLAAVPKGVETTVVTRWRPLDILAGASDLGVFEVAKTRNVRLLLRHDLHAKLFVADERCLVGSANVTATALGWREPTNLELLATVNRQTPEIRDFETTLFATVIPATVAERDQMIALVDRLRNRLGPQAELLAATEDVPSLIPPTWVPRVSNPEDLYAVYCGELDAASRNTRPTMLEELALLGMAPGMLEGEFRNQVALAIAQAPVVKEALLLIDETGDVTEAEFDDLLNRLQADRPVGAIADSLIVLQRWLSHFMPENYETTQESIRLIRAKRL